MKHIKWLIPISTLAVVAPITSCACFSGYKVHYVDIQGVSFPNAGKTKAKRHQHFAVIGTVNPGMSMTFWSIKIGNNTYLSGTDDRVKVVQHGTEIHVSINALLVENDIYITVHAV